NLVGTNSYTGDTIVNAGQLINAGSLPNSPNININSTGTFIANGTMNSAANVTVNSGGVLSGAGQASNVILQDGGTIRPGASSADGSIGTLTLNNLTANGGSFRL